jgi:hypothetical protein
MGDAGIPDMDSPLSRCVRSAVLLLPVLLLAQATGCRKRATPEEEVRTTIEQATQAVRDKDLKRAGTFLSKQFAGADGTDRRSVMAMLQMEFMRRPSLHIFAHIQSIDLPAPGNATVELVAAMAAVPIDDPAALSRASADVYRFDFTLADEDGAWRLVRARWSPARIQDLL